MFYVYVRNYDKTWEPAEGGYYVQTSTIEHCDEHLFLEDAYDDFLEAIMVNTEVGYIPTCASFKCGFETRQKWNETLTMLLMPWVDFERTGYIGSGFTVGISCDKPEDEPYGGYC